MLGEIEHLAFDLQLRHILERLRAGPNFVVVVQRRGDQALAVGTDENRAHSPEKDGPRDGCDLRLPHAVAQCCKRIGAHAIWSEVVGLVEVDVVDVGAGDERLDFERLVALRDRGGHLVWVDDEILAVLDLKALRLGFLRHQLFGLAVDEDAVDPVACRRIDRVESDAVGGGGCRIKRYTRCDLSELEEAFPLRSMTCHTLYSESPGWRLQSDSK